MKRKLSSILFPLASSLAITACATNARDYYQRPFSDNSPWNRTLESYGTSSGSLLAPDFGKPPHIHINSNAWSIPFYLADATDNTRSIQLRKADGEVAIPFPLDSQPAVGTDAHLSIMSADQSTIHEFFRFDLPNRANIYREVDARGIGVAEQSGQNIGSRAYGGSSVGGLIRQWELESGSIDHALAIALSVRYLKPGYVYPATSEDGFSEERYSGSIPMGSLLTIPPGLDIDTLVESRLARLIARALQKYGAYVVDSGGDDAILFYVEPGLDPDLAMANARELDSIIPYLRIIRRPVQGSSESGDGDVRKSGSAQ
ncbi:hypothetical protein [Haliea sp. E17]|uniref:hypothetical protein n=1 Tax=Haliea sp. E17 TaxID=3401576 RepID=UPI003AAF8089